MKQATISLCMIARNESENIGRCLRSVKDYVDEIIVVDTGSADDTTEIARAWGARVIEAKWRDDFSHARNISIKKAAGDWILFLDCDEELAPGSGPELRALIRDSRYEAYFIQVANLTEIDTRLVALSIRLFRNRKIFRFEGKIHEQIAGSIIAHYGQQSIGHCNLSIVHHGYNTQQANIQAKIKRNLRILNNLADSEKNGFFYYNLGTEHLRLGEHEQALACFRKAAGLTTPNQGYGPILALRTVTTLMELHRYRDAIRHLKYYQPIYREFNDLFFLEAICYLNCGWYSQASKRLERYFAMPPAPAWYPTETVYFGASAEEYRDWLQARLVPRDHPDISVCVIGRDEAGQIESCIQSANEIAREVIYVDTGSSDNTPAVAFQSGARVCAIPWPGSFSEARNYALDQAAGEWVLMLDADEALADESRKQIADLVREARPDQGGYILKVCTFLDSSLAPGNCHIAGSCRLFRRAPAPSPAAPGTLRARRPAPGTPPGEHPGGWGARSACARYRGATGEEVVTSLLSSGMTVSPADITVNHLHYQAEPRQIARKRQWKCDAINQGMKEDPLGQNYMLGVELFYARDFAAATDLFEACRQQSDMAGTPHFFYYYALSLINTQNCSRAAVILEEGAGLFPDYTDLIYLQAIAHSMMGNTGVAETLLRRCLEMGETPWQKYLASPGAGSFKAMCSLGTILAQQGNITEALDLLFKASSLPGGFEQAIEGVVILQDQLAVPLEQVLENRGLLNSKSLSAASKACARLQRFENGLRCLAMACDQVAREHAPRHFTGIIRAIDLIIQQFCQMAAKSLPDQPLFNLLDGER